MGSVNSVFLMGNLTADPNLRRTPAGTAVADLRLAVSNAYRNKEGVEVNRACFADVVSWGRQAETCAAYLSKGSAVMVEGKLVYDQWQTPQGEKRSKLRVKANRVQFLGRRDKASKDAVSSAEGRGNENGGSIPF